MFCDSELLETTLLIHPKTYEKPESEVNLLVDRFLDHYGTQKTD